MAPPNLPYPQHIDVGYPPGSLSNLQAFDQRSYSAHSSNSQPYSPQQDYMQHGYSPQAPPQGYKGAPMMYSNTRFSRPVSLASHINRDTWNLAKPEPDAVAQCIHDFIAENPDEINVQAGEQVTVIMQVDPDWVVVRNERGEMGLMPLNHIQ